MNYTYCDEDFEALFIKMFKARADIGKESRHFMRQRSASKVTFFFFFFFCRARNERLKVQTIYTFDNCNLVCATTDL